MSRTFTSTRAAIGHAIAVQGYAAGLAHLSGSPGGPPPDHALASDVMACIRRAGLDPHATTPLFEAVKAWATSKDQELDAQMAGKLDQALRHIGESLMWARIVVPAPRIEPCSHRAVEVAGVVSYHACADPRAGAPDRALLQQRIEHGLEAPERAEVPELACPDYQREQDTRPELLDACAVAFDAGDLTTGELDKAIADELDVGLSRAGQLRRAHGIVEPCGDQSRFGGRKRRIMTVLS